MRKPGVVSVTFKIPYFAFYLTFLSGKNLALTEKMIHDIHVDQFKFSGSKSSSYSSLDENYGYFVVKFKGNYLNGVPTHGF
jgi:hypothetical protein